MPGSETVLWPKRRRFRKIDDYHRTRERLKRKSRRECRLGRASGSEPGRPKRKSIPEEFVESVPHYVAVRFFWSGKRGGGGKRRTGKESSGSGKVTFAAAPRPKNWRERFRYEILKDVSASSRAAAASSQAAPICSIRSSRAMRSAERECALSGSE